MSLSLITLQVSEEDGSIIYYQLEYTPLLELLNNRKIQFGIGYDGNNKTKPTATFDDPYEELSSELYTFIKKFRHGSYNNGWKSCASKLHTLSFMDQITYPYHYCVFLTH